MNLKTSKNALFSKIIRTWMYILLPQVSLMIFRQPGKFTRYLVMPRMLCLSPQNTRIQGWCWDNLLEVPEKDILVSSSPDLNPLDKIVRGVSLLHVNKTPYNTAAFLMQKIMAMMGSFDRDTMAKDCRQFWSMVEAVMMVDGNFFKIKSFLVCLPIIVF
jgi:hypothetical protein